MIIGVGAQAGSEGLHREAFSFYCLPFLFFPIPQSDQVILGHRLHWFGVEYDAVRGRTPGCSSCGRIYPFRTDKDVFCQFQIYQPRWLDYSGVPKSAGLLPYKHTETLDSLSPAFNHLARPLFHLRRADHITH